jgi:hypothetical protein
MPTLVPCACGCGTLMDPVGSRGRPKRFLSSAHVSRAVAKARKNKFDPTSTNWRTGRERARKICTDRLCEIDRIGNCSGRIEIHHKDGNPMNNEPSNLIALCTSHHRLVEQGRIDLANPVMPPFVIRGGIRRYLYRYSAMPRSEACKLREARKRERKAVAS